jgi:tRNA-splicing ligase RtcB
VYVGTRSGATLAEEAPGVYADVDGVVRANDELGVENRVVRTFPDFDIKG